MNTLTQSALKKEIQLNPKQRVYFLYGEEEEKIKRFSTFIEKSQGKVDRKVYYGDDLIMDNLESYSQNFSLFEQKKIFVIKSAELIPAKKWSDILKILNNISSENLFIFQSKSLDNRQSYAKFFKKNNFAILRCTKPNRQEFIQWANTLAKEEGKKINMAAIQLLMEFGGLSLSELAHSIKKIALYLGSEHELIQENHIKEIIHQTKPEIIFEYIDSIIQKNQGKALKQILNLYRQGVEAIAIVALLGKQYRWMINISARIKRGQRIDQISRELRMMPQLAKKLAVLCKQKKEKRIIEDMEALTKADKELKTSMKPAKLILDNISIALTK